MKILKHKGKIYREMKVLKTEDGLYAIDGKAPRRKGYEVKWHAARTGFAGKTWRLFTYKKIKAEKKTGNRPRMEMKAEEYFSPIELSSEEEESISQLKK
jgi:hypothetical protein